MSPFDLNQVSIIPLEEGERDLGHIPPSTLADHTSSFSCPNPLSSRHDQIADHCLGHHLQEPQQRPKEQFLIDRSSDHMTQHPSDTEDDYTVKLPLCDPDLREGEPDRPGKWMSSKMRFMRKMMNSTHIVVSKPRGSMLVAEDQSQANQGFGTSNQSSSSPSGGIIRVCSDCNTTKTPLWRSGPRGPKSLCNACGIRQRKARRAMAAAALNGGLIPATAPAKVRKVKKLDIDRTLPFKKRCKVDTASTTAKKLCFDEVRLSSSKKNTAIQKVFPQEERDAAILLMALSCGLIRS